MGEIVKYKGMKFVRKSTHPVKETLDIIVLPERRREYIDFDGDKIKTNSPRYKTFKKSGLKCVECGIIGTFFAKEKSHSIKTTTYHFNLYAIHKDGHEVMMTKDHIIPKSKGGSNHLKNLQTMCSICNCQKGNKV